MNALNPNKQALDIPESPLCFGTMTFGDGASERTSLDLYARCRAHGITHFDCANIYADGEAESILGKLVRRERDAVCISTKAYYPMPSHGLAGGLTKDELTTSLDNSLKRLRTDYVDVFYLHSFDQEVPLAETLATIDDFVRSGKVRYVGVSNFAAWQVMKANSIASSNSYAPVSIIQPMYNVLKRQCESELLPMAAAERLKVYAYGPVAGGFLTGKHIAGFERGRFATSAMYRKRYGNERYFDATRRFVTIATRLDVSPATLAIAWVVSNPGITAPIVGARNLVQLATALDAIEFALSDEDRQQISDISDEPAIATDRSEEA